MIGQGFYSFPYLFDLEGDYHKIGQFLSGVESHASFMQVMKADLTGANEGAVRMKVTLHLYGSAPSSEAKAPAPPPAAPQG